MSKFQLCDGWMNLVQFPSRESLFYLEKLNYFQVGGCSCTCGDMCPTSMSPPWTAVFPPCSNWSLGDQGPKYQMLNWNILKENIFWFFSEKNWSRYAHTQEFFKHDASIFVHIDWVKNFLTNKKLPKVQRTQGLSSAHQNNFFWS